MNRNTKKLSKNVTKTGPKKITKRVPKAAPRIAMIGKTAKLQATVNATDLKAFAAYAKRIGVSYREAFHTLVGAL